MNNIVNNHKGNDGVEARYVRLLNENGWHADDAQWRVIRRLDRLRTALIANEQANISRRWWHFDGPRDAPQGVYLWGGVGRGKTLMMDLFHESLPVPSIRSHFHRFMYDIHTGLKQMEGRRDPLPEIARRLAARARVLCFDEFFVSDIGDAMLLGRLCTALFEQGVVLVATSNIPPADLYRDGLQRARFLPAIEQILRHCDVLHVDGPTDYRLRLLDQAPMYYTPDDSIARSALRERFDALAGQSSGTTTGMEVNGRTLSVEARAAGVVWFDFDTLCRGPRSQNDYIVLATRLHTILLSGVPQMNEDDDNAARRFIALVDELYERRVNLMIAADVAIDALYAGGDLTFEFERTRSRLIEMQSEDYLSTMRRTG